LTRFETLRPATVAAAPTVRVLTWNIHAGIGPDRRCDLARIVALVNRHAPDIVALQEVDARRPWDGGPFTYLQRALGPHVVEARAIVAPDGDYGHMVISRWPMRDIALHDLSVSGREPRRAIEATVETEHGPLHLVSAHLGLSFAERREQARRLAALAGSAPDTTIMLGDFNDWVRGGAVTRALSALLPARTEHRTFPARLPVARLDRIYCRPAAALVRSWTDAQARCASDHLPVMAEIAIQPPPRLDAL
jgi:endonuclease/exonuclease/phosphatase family metal-dependent hydrolase